eukprot:359834-Chlamydomonas_euryale.AAC.8
MATGMWKKSGVLNVVLDGRAAAGRPAASGRHVSAGVHLDVDGHDCTHFAYRCIKRQQHALPTRVVQVLSPAAFTLVTFHAPLDHAPLLEFEGYGVFISPLRTTRLPPTMTAALPNNQPHICTHDATLPTPGGRRSCFSLWASSTCTLTCGKACRASGWSRSARTWAEATSTMCRCSTRSS